MADGPGGEPGIDRAGRDAHRHPMQWEPEPGGGFSAGEPWLPLTDPERRSVAAQREDSRSLLALYRRLIALRRELDPDFAPLEAPPEVLAYARGGHAIAINLGEQQVEPPVGGEIVLATHPGPGCSPFVPPDGGVVIRRADV